MTLTVRNLEQLAECAITAARAAGKLIAETRPVAVEHKTGGDSLASQVVTEVDRQSQDLILERLEPTLAEFDLALLTEETEDDHSRFEKDFFWCIDPLDGTLPFIEGIPGHSVSIALVARDGTPQIGVVFDPVEQTLYHAVRGQGAFRDSLPLGFRDLGSRLQLITDRSFKKDPRFDDTMMALERISEEMGLDGVATKMTGGAAMNAMWVLENAPACYFKFPKPGNGGGSLWDFAATACIFNEAGAVATDFHGAPLDLNREGSPFMNHCGILYATDEKLAECIMRAG